MTLLERIESQTLFEDTTRNDPIELLMATKRHALDYEESRDWRSVASDTCRACFNCKQRDNES